MKTVKTLFSLTLLFLALTLQAQKVSVTGQVSDAETGEGIPFAGVFIKGTTTGVASDDQGAFIIDVSKGDILLVSSIGYVGAGGHCGVGTKNHCEAKTGLTSH